MRSRQRLALKLEIRFCSLVKGQLLLSRVKALEMTFLCLVSSLKIRFYAVFLRMQNAGVECITVVANTLAVYGLPVRVLHA